MPALDRLVGPLLPRGLRRIDFERRARARFFDRAAAETPVLVAPTDAGRFCVSTADRHIGRALFVKRQYGRKQLVIASKLLRALGLGGPVFVDVGAHIGTSTAVALRDCGFERAVAFEPEPANFRLLSTNLVLNGLDERVEAHARAVSDHAGRVELAFDPARSGDHHVLSGGAAAGASEEVVSVETVRLDDVVSPDGVGLVKIDTEGHEARVLAGAAALLDAGVPVMLEFAPPALREAGGLEDLERIAADRFESVYDIRRGIDFTGAVEGRWLPGRLDPGALPEVARTYADGFTDLLLVP